MQNLKTVFFPWAPACLRSIGNEPGQLEMSLLYLVGNFRNIWESLCLMEESLPMILHWIFIRVPQDTFKIPIKYLQGTCIVP